MTQEAKHTPAPWEAEESSVYAISSSGHKYEVVSTTHPYMDIIEIDANAQLIAAAPELLDALERLVVEHNLETDGATCEWKTLVLASENAKNIIKKAKGL